MMIMMMMTMMMMMVIKQLFCSDASLNPYLAFSKK